MKTLQRLRTGWEDELELPGIAELRSLDHKYDNCCVWELDYDPNGTGNNRYMIYFGSALDKIVQSGMRILALVEMIMFPMVVSFDAVYPLNQCYGVWLFDGFYQTLYLIGVISQFFTAYINPMTMSEVTDPVAIRRHVLCRTVFYLDIVSLCCVPALYRTDWLRLLAYLRVLRCWRLKSDRRRIMLLTEGNAWLKDLFQLLLAIYTCVHLYACVWFKAKVHSPVGWGHEWSAWNGWSRDVFNDQHVEEAAYSIPIEGGNIYDFLFCYMHALRDGTNMLVTWGGPNSISPIELCVITVLGPLSSCIMAYVYGSIVAVLGRITAMEARYTETMSVLNAACEDMQLPLELRTRICRYHSYMVAHHMDNDARALFEELSPNILSETRVFRMRNIILSADVFQGLTPRLILILVSTCTEHLFSPGDLIVRKGEIADCMYIVLKGTLSVLVDNEAVISVKNIYEYEMFGEVCFLSRDQPRMAWIRAETFAVLSRFDRDRFDDVLEDHQELKDGICDAIQRTMNKYTQQVQATETSESESLPADVHETLAKVNEEDCDERTPLMSLRDDEQAAEPLPALSRKNTRSTTIGLNSSALEQMQHVSRNSFTDVISDNLRATGGGRGPASRKSLLARIPRATAHTISGMLSRMSSFDTPIGGPLPGNSLTAAVSAVGSIGGRLRSRGLHAAESAVGKDPALWSPMSPASPTRSSSGPNCFAAQDVTTKGNVDVSELIMQLRVGFDMQKEALESLRTQDDAVLPELGSVMQRECQDMYDHLEIIEKSQGHVEELFGRK